MTISSNLPTLKMILISFSQLPGSTFPSINYSPSRSRYSAITNYWVFVISTFNLDSSNMKISNNLYIFSNPTSTFDSFKSIQTITPGSFPTPTSSTTTYIFGQSWYGYIKEIGIVNYLITNMDISIINALQLYCGIGQYGILTTPMLKKCFLCNSYCYECFNQENNCLSCITNNGIYFDENQCLCNTTGGFFEITNAASQTDCLPCDPSCKNCINSETNCIECNSGFYLNQATSPNQCVSCPYYCSACTTPTNCSSCIANPGIFYSQNQCFCNYNAGFYEYTPSGNFYPTCAACDPNCLTCNIASTNCTSCKPTQTVFNGSCVCAAGFYNTTVNGSLVCLPCHPLSSLCFGPNFWQSLICNSNVNNIDNIQGNTCQCKPGFYYANNTCFPCNGACKKCNVSSTNCQECIDNPGFILQGNSCVCNTVNGFYSSFKNNILSCLRCHPLANTCTGPNFWEALTCNSSIPNLEMVNNSICQCVKGYYFFAKNVGHPGFDICAKCSNYCVACNYTSVNCTIYPPTLPKNEQTYVTSTVASVATSVAVAASTLITGTTITSLLQTTGVAQMCLLFSDVHLTYQIPEMDGLYKGLSVFTLDFLPNTPDLFESWFCGSTNSTTRLLVFESQLATNNDVLFLKNIGCILTFLIIFSFLYSIIILLSWKIEFCKKIRCYFEWNGIFMIILFNYYGILHASFLQIREFSFFNGGYYTANCVFAIVALVAYLVLIIFMIKKVDRPARDLEKESYQDDYGCFYKSNALDGVSKYTTILEFIRKILVIAIVILLDGNLIAQCCTIIVGSGIMAFWYLLILPKVSIVSQLGLIICELVTLVSGFALASFRPKLGAEGFEERVPIFMYTYIAIPLSVTTSTVIEQLIEIGKKIYNWCQGQQAVSTNNN